MVDCNLTKNYFAEKARMAKANKSGECDIYCIDDCPSAKVNNGKDVCCLDLEALYPQTAVEIVQKWSNEHPYQTMKDKFFELFPNAPKQVGGLPKTCHKNLGWTEQCGKVKNCEECWNRPYEE